MYVCTYVCEHVCIYVGMSVCRYASAYVCMYVGIFVCMHACMYVCMHVCTHERVHVGSYVSYACMCIYNLYIETHSNYCFHDRPARPGLGGASAASKSHRLAQETIATLDSKASSTQAMPWQTL